MIRFLRSLGKLSARFLPAVTHSSLLRPHLRTRMPTKAFLTAANFMFSSSKNSDGKLPIGVSTFDELIKTPLFVDKTKFLFDLLMKDNNHRFYVFTSPKMSGKSLQLSMLRRYLSIEVDENGKPRIQSTRFLRKQLAKMNQKQLSQMRKLLCKHLRALTQGETQKGIDKKTQNLSQDDLRKDIKEKMKQFVHLKTQSKELIGLILSKIEGMKEDQQATFIESVIEMKKFRQLDVQELMVFLFKVRAAKETSATVTDEEKIEIENKFNKMQEKEINYSLSRIVSMIKEELRQRKDKQGWLRVASKLLQTLSKREIIQLLDKISKTEDWEEYIEIIRERLSLKAQKEEREQIGSSIFQLKQRLEKTLKRLTSKQIGQNGKLEQKIMTQLRKDEADIMIIKKKKAKFIFYDCRMGEPLEINKALQKRQYENNLTKKQAENAQAEEQTNSKPEYAIYKQAELEHVGEYPVIYLEMPDLRGFSTVEQMKKSIKMAISKAYLQHSYLINVLKELSSSGNSSAIDDLERFYRVLRSNGANSTSYDINTNLRFLSSLLKQHFGNETILLIDELDRSLLSIANKEQKLISEIQPYLIGIFNQMVTYSTICKVISMGITNIFDSRINSEFKKKIYYSIQDLGASWNKHFGFTQQQVNDLTRKTLFGSTTKEKDLTAEEKKILTQQIQRIKEYCNGYWIGEREIYNPMSVINCLSIISADRNAPFTGGWSQTEGFQLIKQLFLRYARQSEVSHLLLLSKIKMKIPDIVPLKEIYSFRGLFYLLYSCGYLAKSKDNEGVFRIPNKQIKSNFYDQIMNDWIYQATNGLESTQWSALIRPLAENFANNSKIQSLLEFFLRNEMQRQKTISGRLSYLNFNVKNIKLTGLELALRLFISFEWYRKQCHIQSNIQLVKIEYPAQRNKLVAMHIIPGQAGPDTAVTLKFNLVQINTYNQYEQADKMLQSAFWQILANGYLLNTARQCQQRENVKNLQITAIVGHSNNKVWIESYAFTKEKGLQLAECVEEFVKKEAQEFIKLAQTYRKSGQNSTPKQQEKKQQREYQNLVRKILIEGSYQFSKRLLQEIMRQLQISTSLKEQIWSTNNRILNKIVGMFDVKEKHQILKNSEKKSLRK